MGGIANFSKSIPGLLFLLIITTILGALIFQRVEGPFEQHARIHVSKTKQKIFVLAQQLARKGDQADWSKLVAQVERYREKLHEAWLAGTDELTTEIPSKWDFWGSTYYCFTLFTTIGYGNVYPATSLGKMLTLLYGLISIPLCSLLISRLSSVVVRLAKAVYSMALDSSGVPVGLREAYYRADENFDFRILPCLFTFTMYLMLGAFVYSYTFGTKQLNWSILDSIYFAYISITTVGFGDLVPDKDVFLAILSVTYILIGLSFSNTIFGRLTSGLDQALDKLGTDQSAQTGTTPETNAVHQRPHTTHLKQM